MTSRKKSLRLLPPQTPALLHRTGVNRQTPEQQTLRETGQQQSCLGSGAEESLRPLIPNPDLFCGLMPSQTGFSALMTVPVA